MLDRKRLFVVIFALTTGSAALLSYAAISMTSVEKTVLVGFFVAVGLVTSAVVYAVVSSMAANVGAPESVTHEPVAAAAPPKELVVPEFDSKAAQTLALLQKKGRLIDFLQEDIGAYKDDQIGHAVRAIHSGCREAIAEYIKIEPVRPEAEGAEVTVETGFDPSSIRLTGNVAGQPPFRGVLRHSGWRVVKTSMPEISEGQDTGVVEPAEVEIL